ncbi:MAG: MBL fold metallo-hydrolase, partial [Chloroflexota bacterium]
MLEQLSDRVFLAPGAVNIGVIKGANDSAILVDSGLNDTSARKVLRWIDQMGLRVEAIVTTHGHADHFGGNSFVVRRTGAEVWAPRWDEAVLRYPLFQSICLFGGADPPSDLRSGFLLAEPSPVDHIYDAGRLVVAGTPLRAISLAGHSGNQMGIVVDDVFFCADVVLSETVLTRYKIPYLFSVRDHLDSLDRARDVEAFTIVPGHGPRVPHIGELVDLNRRIVDEVAEHILE